MKKKGKERAVQTLAVNWRFGVMAAVAPLKRQCKFETLYPAGSVVGAATTPSRWSLMPIRLKVEINCREHFNILGLTQQDFSVNNQWFSGSCKITTYHLDELLGTKISALYQRRKGRDLFDLYKALSTQNINIKNIIRCYREYIGFVVDNPPTQKEYLQNMELKMQDEEFLGDTNLLLRIDDKYNPIEAWELMRTQLIEKL